MLHKKPRRRLTIEQALNHRWISNRTENTHTNTSTLGSLTNLSSFKTLVNFQRIMITYMSRNIMTAEETEHVRQVFTKLDADGNGTLSFEEIRNGFTEHYAMSSEELEDILRI